MVIGSPGRKREKTKKQNGKRSRGEGPSRQHLVQWVQGAQVVRYKQGENRNPTRHIYTRGKILQLGIRVRIILAGVTFTSIKELFITVTYLLQQIEFKMTRIFSRRIAQLQMFYILLCAY